MPYAGRLSRSSLTQPHAELAKEFWAVVNRLQIGRIDALQLIGHGGQAARTLRLSARQRRMVRDLVEIELAMRGLHLSKGWMNQARRDPPFFGRTPLELIIAENSEGSGQLIEFLTRLRFNRRIR